MVKVADRVVFGPGRSITVTVSQGLQMNFSHQTNPPVTCAGVYTSFSSLSNTNSLLMGR
jgi:hypothetical protein